MAGGIVSQASDRAHVGTYSMKLDAVGGSLYSNFSNYIDVDLFQGNLTLGAWVSTANMSGCSLRGLIYYYNASSVQIGSPVYWLADGSNHTEFIHRASTVLRSSFPAGTRFIRLRFAVLNDPSTAEGDAWIDGVQAVPGDFLPAWMPNLLSEVNTLDDIPNGASFGKVKAAALMSDGRINLASSSIAYRGALALKSSVSNKDINSDADSLKKVTDGLMTANAKDAILIVKSGTELNATGASFLPKVFSEMPEVGDVADGELFAVKEGSKKGIYIRTGTTAMDGAGAVENFNIA